jgi:uroporphyrinogen-III synthase
MIPNPIAPLTALSVLVTRPATQAASLCLRIEAAGGEAIAFPAIAIEPIAATAVTHNYDLAIFTSVNAVHLGLPLLPIEATTHIAAIGNATAQAIASANRTVAIVAPASHTSESLLAVPEMMNVAGKRVLIVRGLGGRDLMRTTLTERGAVVDYLEVYRRVPATPSMGEVSALEDRWQNGGVDVVTLTSVEILDSLFSLLTDRGRVLCQQTPFVAVSERIANAARAKALAGPCSLPRAADDESIVGALAHWHARAKTQSV